MESVEATSYTADEIRQRIDAMARRYGISGQEFIEAVTSGEVGEQCAGSADIAALVRLLPEGRFDLVR